MPKKKKKSNDAGINMDVMMDSMTNVVGTLLLILIVVQIQISGAVVQIESVLKKITQTDLNRLNVKIAEQNKRMENVDVEALDKAFRQAMDDVDEAQLRVNIYARKVKTKSRTGLLDVEELIETKIVKTAELELARSMYDGLTRELERLRAQLAKTPKPDIPDGTDIEIPASNPMPKGAQLIKIMCRYNRLYYIRDVDYRKAVEKIMESKMSSMVYTNYTDPKTKKPVVIYDHRKTFALAKTIASNLDRGNTNITINTSDDPYYNRIRLRFTPTETGGLPLEAFAERNNQFRKDVIKIRKNKKYVYWFYIYKDSLEVYLKAREICQSINVPHGWEYYRWTSMAPPLKYVVNPLKIRTNRVSAVEGRARASNVSIPQPKRSID